MANKDWDPNAKTESSISCTAPETDRDIPDETDWQVLPSDYPGGFVEFYRVMLRLLVPQLKLVATKSP